MCPSSRVGRPPSCDCGTCEKCRRRVKARERYQAKSLEERREFIARRDPERVKVNDRARYLRDKEKRRALMDKWHRENPERSTELKQEWNRRNPEKREAQVAVGHAIRDGRLSKEPCEKCGDSKVQGHHDDYSKPLDVRWLCPTHHAEHHVQQRGLEAAARPEYGEVFSERERWRF
jgi:hypothetical protein